MQDDQSEKIQAFTSETVILPCKIDVVDELPTVEWSKEGLDPNIVFVYRDGCETFDKNKAYWYRTNLLMNELKDGNISLMISNVQLMDAGKYQCMVVTGKNRKVVKTLELVVGKSKSIVLEIESPYLILLLCFPKLKVWLHLEECGLQIYPLPLLSGVVGASKYVD